MPQPPIFVEDHGDVSVYASINDAQAAVEAVDVSNSEYRFYDAEGLVLLPEVVGGVPPQSRVRRLIRASPERVILSVPDHEDRRAEELAAILRGFLSRAGSARAGIPEEELGVAPLRALVDATAGWFMG